MKGRLELRFIAPNTGKLRSRVENPAKNLSEEIRKYIGEAVAKVAEANQFEIKAEVLKKLAAKEAAGEIKFNNPQHRAQVFDITGDIFSTAFCASKEEFDSRFPSEKSSKDDDGETPDAAPAETPDAAPAETPDAAPAESGADEFED